jgi:hypothetical protein
VESVESRETEKRFLRRLRREDLDSMGRGGRKAASLGLHKLYYNIVPFLQLTPSDTYTDHRCSRIYVLSTIKRTCDLLHPALGQEDEAKLDRGIIQGPSPKERALVPCANFVEVA